MQILNDLVKVKYKMNESNSQNRSSRYPNLIMLYRHHEFLQS